MELVAVIAGMTAVTYLPRLLPLVVTGGRRLSRWERRALRLVPVTAVGALLVPQGFTAVDGDVALSSVGLVAAVALTLTVRQPFFVVVGSVATVTLAILLGV